MKNRGVIVILVRECFNRVVRKKIFLEIKKKAYLIWWEKVKKWALQNYRPIRPISGVLLVKMSGGFPQNRKMAISWKIFELHYIITTQNLWNQYVYICPKRIFFRIPFKIWVICKKCVFSNFCGYFWYYQENIVINATFRLK